MICPNCGKQIADGVAFCGHCGTKMTPPAPGYSAPPAPNYAPPAPNYAPPAPNYGAPNYGAPGYGAPNYGGPAPINHLTEDRSLGIFILLSLVTCGIYPIVAYCKMVDELNIAASRYDGKSTMNYFVAMLLGSITCGIYLFVWFHNYSERIGNELRRRGINYDFSASTFWLWYVLGSLIVVGPWVYSHKLITAQNKINHDYNMRG